jgi:hypothetical protein
MQRQRFYHYAKNPNLHARPYNQKDTIMNKFDPSVTLNRIRAPRTLSEAFKGAEYASPLTHYKKSLRSDFNAFWTGILVGALLASIIVPAIINLK